MLSYQERNRLAKERLRRAERAADAYVKSGEHDRELLKCLLEEVNSARNEVFNLLSTLCPEDHTPDSTAQPS